MRCVIAFCFVVTLLAVHTSALPQYISIPVDQLCAPANSFTNITLDQLNNTVPHLVSLLTSIESYANTTLESDLEAIEPKLQFLAKYMLPAKLAGYVYEFNSFVKNELSWEFNDLVWRVSRYVSSNTLLRDISAIERFIVSTVIQERIPEELVFYLDMADLYFSPVVSDDFKTLVVSIIHYVNHHLENDLELLVRMLKNETAPEPLVSNTTNLTKTGNVTNSTSLPTSSLHPFPPTILPTSHLGRYTSSTIPETKHLCNQRANYVVTNHNEVIPVKRSSGSYTLSDEECEKIMRAFAVGH